MSASAKKCSKCRGKSRVLYTRDAGRSALRERQCKRCGERWNTREERAQRGWVKPRDACI